MHTNKGISIIITLILIVISFFIICFLLDIQFSQKESIDNTDFSSDGIIDDRISPFTVQGLFLEVKRIRHRGIIDQLMNSSIFWERKPEFYVITNIDGKEYPDDKEKLFNPNISIYKEWDTIFQEFRAVSNATEEQKTSKISITLMEIKKKGLFRSEKIKRDTINLIYDYKTGRWDGDDNFTDHDGYGHFRGKNFEIWFNLYQTDYDHDGIPYWTEVNVLDTNPRIDDSKLDPDSDGINTTWEWKWGYDPHVWDDHVNLDPDIDGIENVEEYQMEKWFADPFSKDIYIEVDGMEPQFKRLKFREYRFDEESKQFIIERFAKHGINVYIDDGWQNGPRHRGGEMLGYVKPFTFNSGIFLSYYNNYFNDDRKEIFRYSLVFKLKLRIFLSLGFAGSFEFNKCDGFVIGNSNVANTVKSIATKNGLVFTRRAKILMNTAAFMHEIGHTLGLTPSYCGGIDNDSFMNGFPFRPIYWRHNLKTYRETWGKYYSIMNYFYRYDKNLIDYSDGSHGDNDQDDWDSLYLPHFQIENTIVFDPDFSSSEKGVSENINISLDGWEINENLTEIIQVNQCIFNFSVDNCDLRVLVKKNDVFYLSDRDVRIYAKPRIPITVPWSLIYEGYLNDF